MAKSALLRDLNLKEISGEFFVCFNEFIQYLQENHKPTDNLKNIKPSNVRREIEGYSDAVKTEDNTVYLKFHSVLRYMFSHADNLEICRKISMQVTKYILGGKKNEEEETILQIYKTVVESKCFQHIKEQMTEGLDSEVFETPYIHNQYRCSFSEVNWKKVCIFEHHFAKYVGHELTSYEKSLKERLQYLKMLNTVTDITATILEQANGSVQQRNKRKTAHDKLNGVLLRGIANHDPVYLENTMLAYTDTSAPDKVLRIVAVDCDENCVHLKGIHTVMEVTSCLEQEELNDLAFLAKCYINRKHKENCPEVVFVTPGTIKNYITDENCSRYQFRDDLFHGKIDSIIYSVQTPDEPEEQEQTQDMCGACFHEEINISPLGWTTFDIIREWYTDVPLIMQIILGSFINKNSMKKSKNTELFLKSKMEKLYITYDRLLNILNRKHIGVLQQRNTNELCAHFHSITSVFEITSAAGVTSSLNEAERQLKERANKDLCYYNTFVKRYPISSAPSSTGSTSLVNLRECILLFMMDNLVRLSKHQDTMRGESRSFQLCTLPLSVKGLPMNSDTIQSWHTNAECDGTGSCVCLEDIHISKEKGQDLLFCLSEEEAEVHASFLLMNRWYFLPVWKKIKQENNIYTLMVSVLAIERPHHEKLDELEQLEKSFMSMGMEGDEFDSDVSQEQAISDIEMEDDLEKPQEFDDSSRDDAGTSITVQSIQTKEVRTTENIQTLTRFNHIQNMDNDEYAAIYYDSVEALSLQYTENQPTSCTTEHSEYHQHSDDLTGNIHSEVTGHLSDTDVGFEEVDLEEEDLACILDDIQAENIIETPKTHAPEQASGHVQEEEYGKSLTSKMLTGLFGFTLYQPPPLLCRHPPPATGKDDDVLKLQEILDDLLIKSGNTNRKEEKKKILFAPDNKIGKNLLQLMKKDSKYEIFLPDFPPLHLRKSKIINLFAAYKDCGLTQILQYMKDDKEKEWTKLVTLNHIDVATRYVWRIQSALQLAFFLQYLLSLTVEESKQIIRDLDESEQNPLQLVEKWDAKYLEFIALGASENATFRLHVEMAKHCQEVTAIYLGERIGGPKGYRLLLSAVKESIPFAFLNGATSYAPYATELLFQHYKSGIFYQNMKSVLFSTPYENSQANFGMDAQREMEHKEALRSFRSGGTLSSVIPRMALIDELNAAHQSRTTEKGSLDDSTKDSYEPGFDITENDLRHIIPTAVLIIRRGALETSTNIIPYNVYNKEKTMLSTAVLDSETISVGKYMVEKFTCKEEIFGYKSTDHPRADAIEGPKTLVDKVKKSKGTTVRRTKLKIVQMSKTDKQLKEEKRQKKVERMKKKIDALSSEMNACQALLKPDCSKPKVQKAQGVQKALTSLLSICIKPHDQLQLPRKYKNVSVEDLNSLSEAGLYWSNSTNIPGSVRNSVKFVTLEFAGVKFKAKVQTGLQYLKYVENSVLKEVRKQFPSVEQVVMCEEKYTFTPNDFKSATRNQRQRKETYTCISHLKTGTEILSDNLFERESVTQTDEGKSLISTYVAKNAQYFTFCFDLKLDIDSEFCLRTCDCEASIPSTSVAKCECMKYTVPVRFIYSRDTGYKESNILEDVKQRKGEAEMAQVDWVIGENDTDSRSPIFSIVSSGDIDSVLIHMFAVSKHWKRGEDRKFLRQVYVSLQKPGKTSETYCITKILEVLENDFDDPFTGMKLAAILSIGGNDFLPKFYGISHYVIMSAFLTDEKFHASLFQISEDRATMKIDMNVFSDFVKCLYCPKSLDPSKLSYDDVRYLSIYGMKKSTSTFRRSPQMWMPPSSAVARLCCLIDSHLQYIGTAGYHDALLPDFIGNGGLQTTVGGGMEYDFGPDAYIGDVETMLTIPSENFQNKLRMARTASRKRRQDETPQKGQRRKRYQPATSTPRK